MKKILLSAICSLLALAALAQDPDPATYEARFVKLNKAFAKKPDNVETLYKLAQFYAEPGNPMRSIPMAMKFIQRTEDSHIQLISDDKDGELGRLIRNGITLITIRQAKQAIIDSAFSTIERRTDLSSTELDTYMDAFGIDISMVRLLRQRRITQVYEDDLRKATAESYYHFIDTYPGTDEAYQMETRLAKLAPGLYEGMTDEAAIDAVAARFPLSPSVQRAAERQKSRQAYALAGKRNDVAAYQTFLKHFPSSDESEQARERLDKLLEVTYAKCKTAYDYALFAHNYPDISLADKALDRMKALLDQQRDVKAARFYLENFKFDVRYNDIFNRYYSWHAAEGNGEPIRRFIKEHPDFPYSRVVDIDADVAERIDRANFMAEFLEVEYPNYSNYVRQFTGKGISFIPLQRMIQLQVASRNYQAALDRIRKFDICFENVASKEYKELQRVLSAPATGRKAIREFSATYHVMNPSLNEADGNLYFTRTSGTSSRICYAVNDNGTWTSAGEARFLGATENDGLTLFGFYAGGTRMLLGSEGNVMMAEKEGNGWRVTDIPPYPVNTDYIETDAYMLPDGSGILLASDRPEGYNLQTSGAYFHGDTALATDLYYIPFLNGSWGTPVNLGSTINTPFCERSPILSRNLKTLYFVSDGRGSLGYGDIYMTTRTSVGDWTAWSEPVNIGKEINSGFVETTIGFSPDEKRILFSSNRDMGQFSCYSFTTAHEASNSYQSFSLDVLGMESSLLRVHVADLTLQAISQVIDCSGEDNVITFSVHNDKNYAVMGDAGAYFVPAVIVDPKSNVRERLKGYTFPVLVAMDKPVPLYAVDFDDASTALTPVAELQLQQLARFLERNPEGIVEFSIDVAGSDETLCYNLSIERGHLIRNFMNYNGIDSSRIIISPYGNVNVKRQGRSGVSARFRE